MFLTAAVLLDELLNEIDVTLTSAKSTVNVSRYSTLNYVYLLSLSHDTG